MSRPARTPNAWARPHSRARAPLPLRRPEPGPVTVPRSHLSRQMDAWTILTLQAGRHLAALYRRLGDPRQAATALEVAAPSEERARRWNLPVPLGRAGLEALGELEAEALAWELLIEAQAGFCSFNAMMERPASVVRIAERAYRKSLQGLRTAFPLPEADAGLRRAILAVSTRCADLFILDLGEDGTPAERAALHQNIQAGIRTTFLETPE